eukprot:1134840-Pelagomonas_calceolata.AAC.3
MQLALHVVADPAANRRLSDGREEVGYPGGLKSRTADKLWEKVPTEILCKAVSGMLPKNK